MEAVGVARLAKRRKLEATPWEMFDKVLLSRDLLLTVPSSLRFSVLSLN
jgi:hypothetical protein